MTGSENMKINATQNVSEVASSDAPGEGTPLELTVVMPCLNEELTVGTCVRKAVGTMRTLGIAGEVVIVDNGSTDRSCEIATAEGARVIHHDKKGYGNALRRGFAEARGRYIIMGDSDDSYDFTDLARYVERLRGGAELVMGNRLKGEIKPGAMPWHHRWIGNPGLTWFLNLLFRTGVGDTHCGMRGFTKEAVKRMDLRMPGMEMASEMVIKASQAKLRIEEMPIVLYKDGRDRPPHLRSFRDGWRHLRFMLMCAPAFLFVLPGMVMALLGVAAGPIAMLGGYGTYTQHFGPNFLFATSLMAVIGTNLMFFGLVAKLITQQFDPVFTDPRLQQMMKWFSLERGIWLGISFIGVGCLVIVPVIAEWVRSDTVRAPALWISGMTLVTLGIETTFASFLLGILDLSKEGQK